MRSNIRSGWACRALRSPLGSLHGAVIEADGDVLGVAWDEDPAPAALRAAAEAVERTALKTRRSEWCVKRASAEELGSKAPELGTCVRFTTEQIENEPALAAWAWTERTPTSWAQVDANGTNACLLPVDLVQSLRVDPIRIRCASSIGTACGHTWADAVTAATFELVERHVVALSVYEGAAAPELAGSEPLIQPIAALLAANGLGLRAGLLANTFGVPVAIAAIVGDGEHTPAASFGSAARASAAEALRAATLEAVHTFHLGWRLMRRGDAVERIPRSINTRVLWWARHGAQLVGEYFTAGSVPEDQALASGWLERAKTRDVRVALQSSGCEWFTADITPDWADGVKVARVIAPALLQLRLDDAHPYLHAPKWSDSVARLLARREAGGVHPHPYV